MKPQKKRIIGTLVALATLAACAGAGVLSFGAAAVVGVLGLIAAQYAFAALGDLQLSAAFGAITPTFLVKLEDNMQTITENEFARMTMSENLWWREVTRVRQSINRKEIIAWLLSTAQIFDEGKGGNITFDDMASKSVIYEHNRFGAGLKLTIDELTDNDSHGFDFAAEWAAQIGALMAYFPQQQTSKAILNGESSTGPFGTAYDALPYFADNSAPHPNNPYRTAGGYYANLLTGAAAAASGGKPAYPGALPIDTGVTLDVAFANLQKFIAYIAAIKMPNGITPRFLKLKSLLLPPELTARGQQLTNARFIAQAATGGAGSADVEAVIKNWGLGTPVTVQEFSTGVAADATSWYGATEQMQSTQLGALVFIERVPFKVTYYTGSGGGTGVDAILDRAVDLEWHLRGRNANGYGHPYGLFKNKAL